MYQEQRFFLLKNLQANGLIEILKKCRVMLCGGAVLSVMTGQPINDYDLYFRSMDDFHLFKQEIVKAKFVATFTSDRAVTYHNRKRVKLQAINNPELMGDNPMEIFQKFDFSICMGCYDFLIDDFVLSPLFLSSVNLRRLSFNRNTSYPICSLFRVLKYQERGYSIDGLELLIMSLTIHNLKIGTFEDLVKQMIGVDTYLMLNFVQFLKNKISLETLYNFDAFYRFFVEWKDTNYGNLQGTDDVNDADFDDFLRNLGASDE